MKNYFCLFVLLYLALSFFSCGNPSGKTNFNCSVCSSPAGAGSEYCEAHQCEECDNEKDENDRYCEQHKCPECGELKEETAEYCELHACPECGGLKEEDAEYCEDCSENGGSGSSASLSTTLDDCANSLGISEKELSAYERDFNVNRYDRISFEMCELFSDYMRKVREINGGINRLNKEVANGYIQHIRKVTIKGDLCQTMVITKHNVNYLLLVRGNSECSMGTTQFNENLDDWQLVYIHEDPSVQEYKGHYMRILERGGSVSQLTAMMDAYCGF